MGGGGGKEGHKMLQFSSVESGIRTRITFYLGINLYEVNSAVHEARQTSAGLKMTSIESVVYATLSIRVCWCSTTQFGIQIPYTFERGRKSKQ